MIVGADYPYANGVDLLFTTSDTLALFNRGKSEFMTSTASYGLVPYKRFTTSRCPTAYVVGTSWIAGLLYAAVSAALAGINPGALGTILSRKTTCR
jgi:hypothetical protein